MHTFPMIRIISTLLLACIAVPAFAADTAKGTIKMSSDGKPISAEINHVYYITGPDTFAPENKTRRLIFATDDTRAAIEACETARCAMSSVRVGMWVELEADAPMARWWVRLPRIQQSGMGDASILSLTTDTPERVAGTLTINSLGVETAIAFDAGLVKAFDK